MDKRYVHHKKGTLTVNGLGPIVRLSHDGRVGHVKPYHGSKDAGQMEHPETKQTTVFSDRSIVDQDDPGNDADDETEDAEVSIYI